MYKSFIRPHLDYCDIIYHEPPKENVLGESLTKLMEEVEKIQYKAALIVTGAWKGSNRAKLYEELGWESLSDRRLSRRILFFHEIVTDKTPSYLKDIHPIPDIVENGEIPPVINNPARYNATERYKNTFFPNTISYWNIIMSHFIIMPSFSKLKSHLNLLFRPEKKSLYGIRDRAGTRFLIQLRLGLSPLKSHKHRHNFADTPSDKCNCGIEAESTSHFLFNCPLFVSHRGNLASSVIRTLIPNNLNHLANSEKLYLYGHHNLSDLDNTNILNATVKYIKDTERFK